MRCSLRSWHLHPRVCRLVQALHHARGNGASSKLNAWLYDPCNLCRHELHPPLSFMWACELSIGTRGVRPSTIPLDAWHASSTAGGERYEMKDIDEIKGEAYMYLSYQERKATLYHLSNFHANSPSAGLCQLSRYHFEEADAASVK